MFRSGIIVCAIGLLVGIGRSEEPGPPTEPSQPSPMSGMPQLLPDPTQSSVAEARPSVLPDVLPESRSSGLVVIFSDFLLLRAIRSGSEYVLVDNNTDNNPEGIFRAPEADYHAGFRVGGRWRPGRLTWDLGVSYSYWRGSDSEFLVSPNSGQMFTTLTRPGVISTADSASTQNRIGWDLYDLEFGREFRSDQGRVRPHFGVRIADLDRASVTVYDGRDATLARVRAEQQFIGAGALVGGEMEWQLGRFLRLFAQARGGTIVGILETTWRETNVDDSIVLTDLSSRRQQVAPVVELLLGGTIQIRRLQFQAGYLVTSWFQLFHDLDFPDDVHDGKAFFRSTPTSFDGVSVRLAWRF